MEQFNLEPSKEKENSQEITESISLLGDFIESKLIPEDAGLDLISKIKNNELSLDQLSKEVILLVEKRLKALEKLKDDPSLSKEAATKIDFFYRNIKAFLKNEDKIN